MDIDVARLRELAQSDPEEFERQRLALIEDVIASAPPDIQRRLRGTQFRVDVERQRSSNPLSATLRISRMMWESFADLRVQLNVLAGGDSAKPDGTSSPERAPARPHTSAVVLPLRKPAAD